MNKVIDEETIGRVDLMNCVLVLAEAVDNLALGHSEPAERHAAYVREHVLKLINGARLAGGPAREGGAM